MNKNQGLILGIALMLFFTGIALATSTTTSATSDVIIYAFDQNPAGSDEDNEWVTFHNLIVHTPLFIGGLTTAKTDNHKKCSWRSSR
ncbi:hypothetical protein C5S53_01805 [Methanophagales archaeon]|jgi:hypothetical protein|nr:hypothetical protein C5S53_01805 [Methanophagales archaeon]